MYMETATQKGTGMTTTTYTLDSEIECQEDCQTFVDTYNYTLDELNDDEELKLCDYHNAEAAAEEWADNRRQW